MEILDERRVIKTSCPTQRGVLKNISSAEFCVHRVVVRVLNHVEQQPKRYPLASVVTSHDLSPEDKVGCAATIDGVALDDLHQVTPVGQSGLLVDALKSLMRMRIHCPAPVGGAPPASQLRNLYIRH